MAALAYLLPPLSGMIAFFGSGSERVRLHGLQSVVLGAVWPAAMYAASLAGPAGTRTAFAVGALVWIAMIVVTAFGRDLIVPWFRGRLSEGGYRP
jgi:uncharacterized membrane protein